MIEQRRFLYRIAGRLIGCEARLVGLPEAAHAGPPEFAIDFGRVRLPDGLRWQQMGSGEGRRAHTDRATDGEVWYVTLDNELVISFDRRARLIRIGTHPEESEDLTHLLIDLAVPLYLALANQVVLHGALLQLERGAVCVLGVSGAGKSTLAAFWAATGKRSLSDDWFVLVRRSTGLVAVPSHPILRPRDAGAALVPRSARLAGCGNSLGKTWLVPEGAPDPSLAQGLPLVAAAGLDRADDYERELSIDVLSGADGLRWLLGSLCCLQAEDHSYWQQTLPLLAELQNGLGMIRLRVRNGRGGLEAVARWLSEGAARRLA